MDRVWKSQSHSHCETLTSCVIRSAFCLLLLLLSSVYFLLYSSVSHPPRLLWTPLPPPSPAGYDDQVVTPTNVSHLFFGIGGSVATWQVRRQYSQLWWKPGLTKGLVFLDSEPSSWPATCPRYKVSSNTSQFGVRGSATRIARIVSEAYKEVTDPGRYSDPEIRWVVMGDDDTVFFAGNLVATLGRYDHREVHYIGGATESEEQAAMHSYDMAFGGGGFAVSMPAAREISGVLEGCLRRYNYFYGSDQRIHACMAELGISLTPHRGFHQLDIRGDPYGLLAAHPVTPLVTLHHLDYLKPIFPGKFTQLEALSKLMSATKADPPRVLQQTFCYQPKHNWSVSVSWGYTVQIYPTIVHPHDLAKPLQTFQTWRSYKDGPFTFNTRALSSNACERPVVFFLDRVERSPRVGLTSTRYKKHVEKKGKDVCKTKSFVAASRVDTITVVAPKMDPNEWRRVSRRHCCETRLSWWGNRMEVIIRKRRPGEISSPAA